MRQAANLLDVNEDSYLSQWKRYNDLAMFIVRTTLYVIFAERQEPLFSLPEIAKRLERPDVASVLRLRKATFPAWELYAEARRLIAELLDTRIVNTYGSVEALVANCGLESPSVVALGLRLLGRESPALGYDVLTLVPFG